MNDDDLTARVRAAFDALDPVPPHVTAAARAALASRVPGAVLAELTMEPRYSTAALRGTARRLTFTGTDAVIEIEVTRLDHGHEITGRVTPSTPARARLRHLRRGAAEWTADVDPAGQFAFPAVPDGLVSLVFDLPDTASIVTSWVRL
ncbi:hypothetical protein GCM10009678_25140 [Actinomadura kijaniata]|uniref:Carboxypeptidase regulatory-like domain-containing protein n=1 Tax=Actinomadura namibiensis TaxID=182080 RepID=A0A7W3LP69_ACTNM|nr:hypothetical protein [Actinomadura namibiensis]MBA8951801.1 hypothetical protein [Actinomadura namibiensis]